MNSKQIFAAISAMILLVMVFYPPLASGSLSISLKSATIADADHVYMTIDDIWGHRQGQSQSQGWELLFNTTTTIDLVSIATSPRFLKGSVPIAIYDSIRVDVSNVTWAYNGTSSNLQLESRQLTASIHFAVKSSQDLPLIVVVSARSETLQGQKYFTATLNATIPVNES